MARYRILGKEYDETKARELLAAELEEIKDTAQENGATNVDDLTLDDYLTESLDTGTVEMIEE